MHALRLACLFLALMLLFPAQSLAAAAAADAGGATDITSQRVEYKADAQTIVFTGNVHVVRPDMEIWSERLTVILSKAGGASAGADGISASQIEKIIAEKNVRMKRENRLGECQKATYTLKDDLLVMEGDPRLFEGQNSITGTTILFYLSENRSEVIGAPSAPVRVIFTQDGKPVVASPAPEEKPAEQENQPDASTPAEAAIGAGE